MEVIHEKVFKIKLRLCIYFLKTMSLLSILNAEAIDYNRNFTYTLGAHLNYNNVISSNNLNIIRPRISPSPFLSLNFETAINKNHSFFLYNRIGMGNYSNAFSVNMKVLRDSEIWNLNKEINEEYYPNGEYEVKFKNRVYRNVNTYLSYSLLVKKYFNQQLFLKKFTHSICFGFNISATRASYFKYLDEFAVTFSDNNNQNLIDGLNVSIDNFDESTLLLSTQLKYSINKLVKKKRTIEYGIILNLGLNSYGRGFYTYQKAGTGNGFGTIKRNTTYLGFEITYSIFNIKPSE